MHIRAIQRLELETDLRKAIEREEFLVYYQPIVSLIKGTLVGFEALARWQHPTRDIVSPAEFIPVSEETGLIVPLGKWLLKEACQQLRFWQSQYPEYSSLKVSVNLSGKQLKEPFLINTIDEVLEETGLEGQFLKLEITESLLMNNFELVTNTLLSLRKRKIQLSIDDFGTGYSSLSYLHRFPINTIKIDRSFVEEIQSERDNSIIKTIVTLAHMLNMDVIAEGIETPFQMNQLKRLKCEHGQGYFFAKPLNKKEAEKFIASSPMW